MLWRTSRGKIASGDLKDARLILIGNNRLGKEEIWFGSGGRPLTVDAMFGLGPIANDSERSRHVHSTHAVDCNPRARRRPILRHPPNAGLALRRRRSPKEGRNVQNSSPPGSGRRHPLHLRVVLPRPCRPGASAGGGEGGVLFGCLIEMGNGANGGRRARLTLRNRWDRTLTPNELYPRMKPNRIGIVLAAIVKSGNKMKGFGY